MVTIALTVLIPLVGAALPAAAPRRSGTTIAWLAAAPPAIALALLATSAPAVFSGDLPSASWPWAPAIGLNLSFRLDGLALLFAMLILVIGLLIVLYARYYLSPDDPLGRFYSYPLLFMGAMLDRAERQRAAARRFLGAHDDLILPADRLLESRAGGEAGARMALTVTGAGGLASPRERSCSRTSAGLTRFPKFSGWVTRSGSTHFICRRLR